MAEQMCQWITAHWLLFWKGSKWLFGDLKMVESTLLLDHQFAHWLSGASKSTSVTD